MPRHGYIQCFFSLLKDILENVLESAIVSLQDGVLSAHVERPFLLNGELEAAVSEASDGLLERDERQCHTSGKIDVPLSQWGIQLGNAGYG